LQEEAEWAVFEEYLKIKVHVDRMQKLFSNFVLSEGSLWRTETEKTESGNDQNRKRPKLEIPA
jgi:hypothetical protein